MDENPYQPPASDVTVVDDSKIEYAGFWVRVVASVVDSLLIVAVTWPILFGIYGMQVIESQDLIMGFWDFLISWVFPAIAVILFWSYRSATPGKMAVKIKIVDAKTYGNPSTGQLVGRYFAYFVSMLALLLGFLWVAFDSRKQGWHDKLAGTVVIYSRR